MENAPRTAFARARPVLAGRIGPEPFVLRPEFREDLDPHPLRPGAWLHAAISAEARIMTPHGPCPAGRIAPGDHVQTLDHGPCPVLWTGRMRVSARQFRACPPLRMISIPARALGRDAPVRRLEISPRAGVLVTPADGPRAGVLVSARDLVGHAGIHIAAAQPVTYVQILLERHAVIAAEGLAIESFHPCALGTRPGDSRARAEILSLLPDLEHGLDLYGPEVRQRAARAR